MKRIRLQNSGDTAVITISTYPALESSAPEVDSSPASWSTSSSSSSSVVPDSSLEEE